MADAQAQLERIRQRFQRAEDAAAAIGVVGCGGPRSVRMMAHAMVGPTREELARAIGAWAAELAQRRAAAQAPATENT